MPHDWSHLQIFESINIDIDLLQLLLTDQYLEWKRTPNAAL